MLTICARLIVIFGEHFDFLEDIQNGTEERRFKNEYFQEYRQNLELSISISAFVFFIFVLTFHNAYPNKERRDLIDSLSSELNSFCVFKVLKGAVKLRSNRWRGTGR